jgi:diguanylate cyclase (GGDEF)-like protein/PAS domain S-box-containing protein
VRGFRSQRAFRPFAMRSRRTIIAIVATMALVSALSAFLSIRAASGSQHRATVIEVAGRQRTLAERYVQEILLVRESETADPAQTAAIMAASAHALLDGGAVPEVLGDDDETRLSRSSDPIERGELGQEARLITDLSAIGNAVLNADDVAGVPLTAHEHITTSDPIERLRIVAALTSNVSLNASRTFAARDDQRISRLVDTLVAIGVGGLAVSLLLAWALIAATRRQTEHYRSLVRSSTDLVFVLANGCRYVSVSVTAAFGHPESALLGAGYERFVHEDDRVLVDAVQRDGRPPQVLFRMRNSHGEWRHLEAHVSDLREDRHVRGVVLNARDITDRVRLELELTQQAQRDTFGTQLIEALEMADEEAATFEVVERAMEQISPVAPMELLLSDSSRAHLERAATSRTAGAPACPVESPFSCVAVRRGNPVVFDTSESLNACPKLRDRPDGACSAVCVPVSFMGRALGVLHATGPVGEPPVASQVAQLTTLATQAGARIGTVRAFQRTQLQASTDGLTGLVNRRSLESEIRELLRQPRSFALVMADLDRFKQLNDTHGHEAGDRALRAFAQVTQEILREHDVIARWGGEEFVLVLPDVDRHQAGRVLDRIRTQLAASHNGGHPAFTASFGVTDSTRASTLEELLQLADAALYASKNGGRDRATISDAVPASTQFSLVREVDPALPVRPGKRVGRRTMHSDAEDDIRPTGAEIR